mgnify:CR=1 FL=1
MTVRRTANTITISGDDLDDLKKAMRNSLLGTRKVNDLKPGQVQCPFCGDVYMPTHKEHFISGICDACWPDEPTDIVEVQDDGDDDKPF